MKNIALRQPLKVGQARVCKESVSNMKATKKVTLNTRGQYAMTAIIALAKSHNKRPLPLSEIADDAGISLSYLEQLIAGLRRHNLVKSYRGPGGGYMLNKAPEDILVTDILIAAEDSTPAKRVSTEKQKPCPHTQGLWDYAEEALAMILDNVTLEDVLNSRFEKNGKTAKIFEVLSKTA